MLPDPIFVTGCPRSGSSMVAATLAACGAFVGKVGNPRNPRRCSFENHAVNDNLRRQVRRMGYDPKVHTIFPPSHQVPRMPWLQEWLVREFQYQGHKGERWLVKHALLAVFWSEYQRSFPNARWVIVRRDVGSLVQSCMATRYMDTFTDPSKWLQWVEWYQSRLNLVCSNTIHIQVWPTKMLHGQLDEIQKVVAFCGLPWNEAVVRQLIGEDTNGNQNN